MIVSHQHKLIFIKPRKVAGTSFEIALAKFCSEGDIITPISRNDEEIRQRLGFIGPRNFNFGLVNMFSKDKEAEVPGLAGLWDTFKDINAKSETRNREITTKQIFKRHPDVNAQIETVNKWEIDKFGYSLEATEPAEDAVTPA